jgi:transcriptional regulator with XRE-family HTH domain
MSKRKNLVGEQVRRIRDQLGLSQEELAARCQRQEWDIDRFTIARIEAGTRWVGDFEVVELAKALRSTVLRLYGQK